MTPRPHVIRQPEDIYGLTAQQAAGLLGLVQQAPGAQLAPALSGAAQEIGVSPESDPDAIRQGLELPRIREMISAVVGTPEKRTPEEPT